MAKKSDTEKTASALDFEGTSLPAIDAGEGGLDVVDFSTIAPSEVQSAAHKASSILTAVGGPTAGSSRNITVPFAQELHQILDRAIEGCPVKPSDGIVQAAHLLMDERGRQLSEFSHCLKAIYGGIHRSSSHLSELIDRKDEYLRGDGINALKGSKRFVSSLSLDFPSVHAALDVPRHVALEIEGATFTLPKFFNPSSEYDIHAGDVLHTRFERMKVLGFNREMAIVCRLSNDSPIPTSDTLRLKDLLDSKAVLWAERGEEIGLIPAILEESTTDNVPFTEIPRGSIFTFDNYNTRSVEEFLHIFRGSHGGFTVQSLRNATGEHADNLGEQLLSRNLAEHQEILGIPKQFYTLQRAREVDPDPETRCEFAEALTSVRSKVLGLNAIEERNAIIRKREIQIPEILRDLNQGDVIEFSDRSKAITLAREGLRAVMLLHDTDGAFVESIVQLHEIEPSTISGKRSSPEPTLCVGHLKDSPLRNCAWENIRPGAIIYHENGDREEILSMERVPGKDVQHRSVSSIKYHADGTVQYLRDQERNNTYFLTTPPPVVWPRDLYSPFTPKPPKTPVTATSGPFKDGARQLEALLHATEVKIAAQAGQYSDQITTQNYRLSIAHQGQDEQTYVQSVPLEHTFAALKEVHRATKQMRDVTNRLASLCLVSRAPASAVRKFQSRVTQALSESGLFENPLLSTHPELPTSQSISFRFHQLRNIALAHFDKYANDDSPGMRQILTVYSNAVKRLVNSVAHVEEMTAISSEKEDKDTSDLTSNFHTRHYTADNQPEGATLQMIEDLVKASRSNASGEAADDSSQAAEAERYGSATKKGIVVHNYYTVQNLQTMLNNGFELTTHWRLNAETHTPEVSGFVLFKPEMEEPEFESTAFVDITLTAPDAEPGTVQRMLDRKTIELQRTDVEGSYGEIMSLNAPSFGVFMKNGGTTLEDQISHSVSPGGRITRWHPTWIPEHAEVRARYMPYQQKIARAMIQEFKKQMDKEPSPADMAPTMSEDELVQIEKTVNQYRDTVGKPVFTRISFGAGSMTPAEFEGLRGILEEGCHGIDGVIMHSPTLMLQQAADGTVTEQARTGIHQSIATIRNNMADSAAMIGINIHNVEESHADIVLPGVNNGDPIKVIEPEEGTDYITVEDYTFKDRLHFGASDKGEIPFWDMEAVRGHQVGQFFSHDTRDESPRHFKNIAIFGAGGGTIGREIKMLANHAAQRSYAAQTGSDSHAGQLVDPADQQHLILIDGRTEELRAIQIAEANLPDEERTVRKRSSTETFVDDAKWLDYHEKVAASQNRPEYVHIVKSAEEMQAVLKDIGALGERTVLRPHKWKRPKVKDEEFA